MKAKLWSEVLETLVSPLIRAKHLCSSNQSLARALRAVERRHLFEDMALHEELIADPVRLAAYHAGIQRYVTSRDCVLDVGTGTGILAFFAAAKRPRKVYAIDHSKKMLDYARAAAESNGIADLTFVASASHRFHPAEPIDVIVQEQMGIGLFDEGMVEAVLDLRDRCLKPGGRILPAKFEFYLEPVQLVERERIPLVQEQQTHGLRFPSPLRPPDSAYYFREIVPRDVDFLLCEPEPVFTFDLGMLTDDQIPKCFSARKPVGRRGEVNGICMYFKAIFDDEISFSTGPDAVKTHWPMFLYRTPARLYEVGEIFQMQIEAPELSDHLCWSWTIGGQADAG